MSKMELKKAQKTVRIIVGIMLAYALIRFVTIAMEMSSVSSNGDIFGSAAASITMFLSLIVLLPLVIACAGLWNYRNWSRGLIAIEAIIGIVLMFTPFIGGSIQSFFIFGEYFPPMFPMYIPFFAMVLFCLLIIYLFIFNKSIAQVFEKPQKNIGVNRKS